MAGFWSEKRRWCIEHGPALAVVVVLGLIPFLSFLLSGQALFASDQMGAPGWKWYFESLREGTIPLWSPYGLGGMPTFDAGFGDGAYPLFLVMGLLLPVTTFISFNFVLHVLIAGLSSYYLVNRYFRLDRTLSVALSAAYMLNTNFISHIHSGHTGKFYILAWLPFSLYFLLRSLGRDAHWRHSLGLALSIAIFMLTNHLQLTYFVLMGYFLAWAYQSYWLVKEKRLPAAALTAARFWVPILLGIGLIFFMFYPPTQYTKSFSVRGGAEKTTYEHATSWSMHPEEAASLVVPEFTGLNERYWGRNPFKLNSEYPGLSVLFLGVLGLVLFRRAKRGWFWLWGGIGLLSVIFGLGAHTPLFRLFFAFVPGIDKFRAPSMMTFWLTTALLIMSADALARLTGPGRNVTPEQARLWGKRLMQVGLGMAGLLILFGVVPDSAYGLWNSLFSGEGIQNFANQAQAHSAFGKGALKSGVLLGILVLSARKWLLQGNDALRFGLVLMAVTCVDLYWTGSQFIKTYDPARGLPNDPAIAYLKQDTTAFRIFGLPGVYDRWLMQYHGVETTDGWTDNENRIYREYRGNDYSNNPNLMAGLKQNPDGSISGSVFLDMLNVKYLVYRMPDDPSMKLAVNTSSLPRAWMVNAWESAPDSMVLEKMKQPGFDPHRRAYLSPEGAVPDKGEAQDTVSAAIARTRNGYNAQTYRVQSPSGGLLVLSELWFPHWRAEVDGRPADLLRVNYAFRGVMLPAGEHTVSVSYHSPWLSAGFKVGLVSLALLAAFLAGLKFLGPRLEGT